MATERMWISRLARSLVTCALIVSGSGQAAWSQSVSAFASASDGAVSQERAMSALYRPALLSVRDVPLSKALTILSERSGVVIAFSPSMMARHAKTVNCGCEDLTVKEALDRLLEGTSFDYTEVRQQILVHVVTTPSRPNGAGLALASYSLASAAEPARTSVTLVPAPESQLRRADLQGTITGRVLDAQTREPITAAQVIVDGTELIALTQAGGVFTISNVPVGTHTIRVQRIGYTETTAEVVVGEGLTVTVELLLSIAAVGVEEIVAVGYGTQTRTLMTGSVAAIQSDAVQARSVTNPVMALQGRLPGLRVTQSNGQPGREGLSMTIRGRGSFASGNEPLVIVDGIVGDISDLDPAAIESISLLKDASSASIYGARAANGVIVVTTRRGEREDGLKVNYNGRVLRQTPIHLPDLVWNSPEWMEMHNTAIRNANIGIPLYPDSIIDLYRTPSELYPSVNWAELLFRNPIIHSHNLAFTGRSGQTNYHAGLAIWDQEGIAAGFYYRKYTGTLNMDSQLNERIKFGVTLRGVYDDAKSPYNGPGDVMISLSRSRPTYGPLLPDGSGRYTSRAWPQFEAPRGEKNLLGLAEMGGLWNGNVGFTGSVITDVNLQENLTWSTRLGARYNLSSQKYHRPLIPTYNWFTGEFDMYADRLSEILLRRNLGTQTYYTAYSTLNYNLAIRNHQVGVMGGASVEKQASESLQGQRQGFASHALDVLSAGPAEGQVATQTLTEYGLVSLFARLNYNYRQKYLFEATVRRDGSSRLPPANKYAVFPAASVGWRIGEEDFFRDRVSFVDELKIRASYGLLGKDQVGGNYPYQASLQLGFDYPFGSQVVPGFARTSLNNDRIRWEETSITGLGIDLVAGRGLLSLTADYFVKNTTGILRPSQIPGYAGLSAPTVNEGAVQNRGIELTLGHQNEVGGLVYGVNVNLETYRNRVTKFGAPQISGITTTQEGMEIGRYFMYVADGIYKSQAEIDAGPTPLFPAQPGDIRLRDINGDGKVDANDRIDVDGAHPKYAFSFDVHAQWKNFDVAAFFQGEQGTKTMVDSWFVRPFQGGGGVITWWRDAWSPENPDSDKPRLVHNEAPNTSVWTRSTYWLRDASYMRLRNLTVGFRIPSRGGSGLGLGNARIFVNGENLFTLTSFEFGNPEQGSTNSHPVYRTLTFGLDVSF